MKKQNNLYNSLSRVEVIGVPISTVNIKKAIDFTVENIDLIKGGYICASNVHTTVMAHDNKEYLKIQSESIMSLPDGKPLSVIGRKKGFLDMEKTTGYAFMHNILNDKRLVNANHYFYGTTEENINIMIKNIREKYPNINIKGYEPSIFRELSTLELIDLSKKINKLEIDFMWIGIGAPRQEELMYKLKNKTNSVMVGVGGVFNIFSGKVSNAPSWIQNFGLEWFYRLCKEPKRLFKRYFITNSKFIYYVWREK